MSEINYKLILQQIDSFPSLPAIVTNVIEVAGNPESSAGDLVRAVLPDPSMCVTILKIANSVLYGRPKKVSSLETAVMVLGFEEVKNIVLSKAVITSCHKILQKNKTEIDRFWDHSFTCGLAARILAEYLNLPSGQFFMGGLIHDIGKLAMLMTFSEEYDTSSWLVGFSNKQKMSEEKKTFSLSHNTVGRLILQKWNFPDNLLVALECHHNPAQVPKYQVYSLVIQFADLLAYLCCSQELDEEKDLFSVINSYLPELEHLWRESNLPWVEISLESCFAWIKIDRAHGSSIMQIFASA